MMQDSSLAISIKYESKTIFRGARPVEEIVSEFEKRQIPHVALDPGVLSYGNWDIVVAFDKEDNFARFANGEITIEADWLGAGAARQHRVNPLKASKRAHGGK